MNHLLKLGSLLAFPVFGTTVHAQDSPAEVVEVVFTQDMDEAKLDSIQQAVKPLGVDLQINGTEYKDGLLHTIAFSIVTDRGNGSAKGELRPDNKFGFRYYPNGGPKMAMLVGIL